MTLYFLTGHLDFAATTLADLQAGAAAYADPTLPANAAILARIAATLPTPVQLDTGEPLTCYFYDTASTASSWVADAAVTLAAGIGTPDTTGANTYAGPAALTGSPRTGTLALNGATLQQALTNAAAYRAGRRGCYPGIVYAGAGLIQAQFYLHLRKTAAGLTQTVALLPLTVQAGVLP